MSKVYRVIDSDNGGLIAICDSYNNACKICEEYCREMYVGADGDAKPEEVENVWIEETEFNTWLI